MNQKKDYYLYFKYKDESILPRLTFTVRMRSFLEISVC